MNLEKFEEFVRKGFVKKQAPNISRAKSLLEESEMAEKFLGVTLKNVPKEEMNYNFIVNYCYDILMQLIRAKMFIDGYNSGNSHAAEVSYLRNLGFSEIEVVFMDELRYYRNGIKYYGVKLEEEYSMKVLSFAKKFSIKLKKLI